MKFTVEGKELEIREGASEDIPLLLELIRKLGDFEKLEVSATVEILRESLFGDKPAAKLLLAFVEGKPAAYAVYFFSFSTMTGKRGLWLEDIFINPEYRRKGIARIMMAHLAGIAVEHKCGRFEWIVLDWNTRAVNFFKSLGASVQTDWRICRLDEGDLERVAGKIDM